MELTSTDRRLLAALANGLPLTPAPYADLGAAVGLSEQEVLTRLSRLRESGAIRRFGVIVKHRALGYRANAMTVWNVPDDRVRAAGQALAKLPFVTLAYRRPRRLPDWPYNLFCMIHGRDRARVEARVDALRRRLTLTTYPFALLFSLTRFKQRGARYVGPLTREGDAAHG